MAAEVTPRQRIEHECQLRGKREFVAGCIELLSDAVVDDALVKALGGAGTDWVLEGPSPEVNEYWLRVWAARGLFWAWDDIATDSVLTALSDEAWRVREMACRVVAKHQVGEALPVVAELRTDPVRRVQIAASRAVVKLTQVGA
ncbi:MAG TPA: HEAT repeat domain-containing protein [Actinomycetes bacterium]|nr:HEAT repeat domain-containing protein [Actinomycetes bacterium]